MRIVTYKLIINKIDWYPEYIKINLPSFSNIVSKHIVVILPEFKINSNRYIITI